MNKQTLSFKFVLTKIMRISLAVHVVLLLAQVTLAVNAYGLRSWLIWTSNIALFMCIIAAFFHFSFLMYHAFRTHPKKKLIAALSIFIGSLLACTILFVFNGLFRYSGEILPKQTVTEKDGQKFIREEHVSIPGKEDYYLFFHYKNFIYYGPRIEG